MKKIIIQRDYRKSGYQFYWYEETRGKQYNITMAEDGLLKRTPIEPHENGEPFLSINEFTSEGIMQSLTDALAEVGFHPSEEYKEKIKVETLAEERKNELEWHKKTHIDLVKLLYDKV